MCIEMALILNMKLSIFLLVVFSVTVLCVEDKRVTKFKNQHIIETDTEKSCDDLIKEKKIKDNNKPKLRNTFIINAFEKVKDICKEEQRVYDNDNLYTSSETMITLHCKLQTEGKNKGKYEGVKKEKHIEIACENINNILQPVHLQCLVIEAKASLVPLC
uniref:Ribonuclease A-domain domain-containing protein n=1 Tax=Haplochromis burtoni TaxID=8153 RepID=A0A3Q2VPG3_HAPBU